MDDDDDDDDDDKISDIRESFETFMNWRQCASVLQREVVTVNAKL
jgi:hypothetical protein